MFYECESLKEITIPDSVTFIDVECFYGCKSLRKIIFGKKVKTIADGNFAGCESLREIVVKQGNKNLITKDGILYQKKKKILYYAYGNSPNVTIPDGTKKIGLCAFFINPNLQTVTIPASVTLIKGGAFYQCKKLRKVTFAKHSKLKRIEEYRWEYDGRGPHYECFMFCKNLQEMIFPDSLEYTDEHFWGCTSLKKIYIGKKFKGSSLDVGHYSVSTGEKNALKEIVVSKKNKYFQVGMACCLIRKKRYYSNIPE